MERIYQDAIDKNVAAVVVYLSEGSLFYDEEATKPVYNDELANLFAKGVILTTEDGMFAPTSCVPETSITFGETTATGTERPEA